MKLNFDETIVGLDGKPLDGDTTIKDIVVGALVNNYQDEPNLSGSNKFARAQLAQKVFPGGDLDLSVEDVALIKELVGKYGTPIVVLQIFNAIEGKNESTSFS